MSDEEYELIPCTCMCHSHPDVMHIMPCCYDGYKRVKKLKKEDIPNCSYCDFTPCRCNEIGERVRNSYSMTIKEYNELQNIHTKSE